MDIRKEKTQKAIKNAFLELRSKKSIEKITIKELCNLAQINKSTFYSHYDDIYALSETLQMETVNYVLNTISNAQQYSSSNPEAFTRALSYALTTHTHLISNLFSDKEESLLVDRLEEGIKEMIYRKYPEHRNDPQKQILHTYSIRGGYYAYQKNRHLDEATRESVIENITKTLKPLF